MIKEVRFTVKSIRVNRPEVSISKLVADLPFIWNLSECKQLKPGKWLLNLQVICQLCLCFSDMWASLLLNVSWINNNLSISKLNSFVTFFQFSNLWTRFIPSNSLNTLWKKLYCIVTLFQPLLIEVFKKKQKCFNSKIYNFNSTNDGESSQKSHCPSNSWQFINKVGCCVLCNSVKGWGVKLNSHKSQFSLHRFII